MISCYCFAYDADVLFREDMEVHAGAYLGGRYQSTCLQIPENNVRTLKHTAVLCGVPTVLDVCIFRNVEVKKICVRFEVFHGGDYEERCLLGCYAVWLL
jgi:hypothetical protein